jgi:hypothetical protein
LDWIGLDWIGLDWIGLDWIGLDWIGLDWIELVKGEGRVDVGNGEVAGYSTQVPALVPKVVVGATAFLFCAGFAYGLRRALSMTTNCNTKASTCIGDVGVDWYIGLQKEETSHHKALGWLLVPLLAPQC